MSEIKAYAVTQHQKLCRVDKGELYKVEDLLGRGAVQDDQWLLGPDGGAWLKITDEDAALREAWERLCAEQPWMRAFLTFGGPGRKEVPKDGYYVAEGPGVVACTAEKKCDGWYYDRRDTKFEHPVKPCHVCNPHGHEHPTLIPLAECEEISKAWNHLAEIMEDEAVARTYFAEWDDSASAIVVVREEECGTSCESANEHGMRCSICHGTGKIIITFFYWRK